MTYASTRANHSYQLIMDGGYDGLCGQRSLSDPAITHAPGIHLDAVQYLSLSWMGALNSGDNDPLDKRVWMIVECPWVSPIEVYPVELTRTPPEEVYPLGLR